MMKVAWVLLAVSIMLLVASGRVDREGIIELPTPTLTQAPATPTKVPPTPTNTATALTPPTATPVRGGDLSQLPLYEGTTVNRTGQASDGTRHPSCPACNFWYHPTLEAVTQPGQSYLLEVHELCHGHQDWSIGRPLAPAEYNLSPWYGTEEGQDYSTRFPGTIYTGVFLPILVEMEDFAQSCALFMVEPATLYRLSPARYHWFEERFP